VVAAPQELVGEVAEPALDLVEYALWSPVSSKYGAAYGVQAPQKFVKLRNAFAASPYWQIAFQQDETVIFRLDGAGYIGGGG